MQRPLAWWSVIWLIACQIAVLLIVTPTAEPAPFGERPQRIFADALVAPQPALAVALPSAVANDPKTVALDFLRGPGASLVTMANDLTWRLLTSEQFGPVTVVRVSQYKDTVRIWGADAVLQVTGNTVRSLSGVFIPNIAAGTKPALDLREAVKIATIALQNDPPRHHDEERASLAAAFAKPQLTEHEIILFNPSLFERGDDATALAYRLVLGAPDGSASATVIVDAQTGKVWLSFANHHSARNRIVRDANGAETTGGALCYREHGPVGTPSQDCIAAFTNTGLTYDYFFNTFGRDSFDGAGATMVAVVRFGTDDNAFWDGELTAFGPGFATLDVVAHEWTHAVTQYAIPPEGLIYYGQSGALNEAFSDVFAAMIDRDDWLMGEDTPSGAIRSLAHPPFYDQPDRMRNYVCIAGDNGGVHINSGIPNKVAYLMAEGGTFNRRTVPALGREATERIFYRALTHHLVAAATFTDMYNALLAAAAALYGTSSIQYQATQTAAQAVELDVPPYCGEPIAPDQYEPNGSAATATSITVGGAAQRHNFHLAGDQDWVTFQAVRGNVYTIQTSNLQRDADTVLALFGSNGTVLLAQNDDDGGTYASRIDWLAPVDEQLYVRVTNFGNQIGAQTGYEVAITLTPSAVAADAYEPDNTQSAAKLITIGGAAQRHNFHSAGDHDWGQFSATAGSTYLIETLNLGAASDTVLELYDGNGNRLASSDDDGHSRASRIIWNAPASTTFFVRVRNYHSAAYGAATAYDLRVTAIPPVPGDAYEPDNSLSAARAISVDGAVQSHTFHSAGDQDWVFFDAAANTSYVIETLQLTAGSDTVLELYTSDAALLASNDDYNGLASLIGYTSMIPQRLFVRVRHYSSIAGHDQLRYDLRVISVAAAAADAYEPDDTAATAREVVPGTLAAPHVTRHNVHVAGDHDWVRITAIAGNVYLFETAALEERSDTVITLFAADGTSVIAEDDDGGSGFASRLTWFAPANGVYYLRVRHYTSGIGGNRTGYDLRIGTSSVADTPDVYEPDNALVEAKPLSIGSAQHHNFHVIDDQDWVYFDAVAGVEYMIFTSDLNVQADTVLELYNRSGALIMANDDYIGRESLIVWTATSTDRFFVKVRQYYRNSYGAATGYYLNINRSSPDAYEPDNTLDTARPITVNGAAQIHTFHVPNDQDWLVFAATAGASYRIDTFDLAVCSDTVISLYNSNGDLLYIDDNSGGHRASRIDWIAPSSANFYILVRNYFRAAFGDCTAYKVRVAEGVNIGDPYEPDDTLATAQPFNGMVQRHTFHVAGDQDWIYVDVVAGNLYAVRTFNLGSCNDTVLQLYNSDGTLVAENDDYSGTLASQIEMIATTTTRLFIKVMHYKPSQSGECTQYDLEMIQSTLLFDAYEPDNTIAQARRFTVNDAGQNRNFHFADDIDWVSFNAVRDVTYTIYTYQLGAEADTVLELYDGNGMPLMYDDDGGDGWASRIVWTAPMSGTYYVKIWPYPSTGGRPTSTYSFRIVTGSTLSDPEAIGNPLAPLVAVQNETVRGDQLRIVDVTVDRAPQPGQEFTTLVQAVGRAASYKLVVTPKSDLVELLAIEPLDPAGQPLAAGVWMAQRLGTGDLFVTAAWQSDQPATLLRLRWRLRATLAAKQLMLLVQMQATDGNGSFWQSSAHVAVPTLASSAKIATVAPTIITIAPAAFLSIRVIGLADETPKAYLVDINGHNLQQFAVISYAPGSTDTLIATLDPSFKPGLYKVRLDPANGSQLFSETVVRLLAPGEQVYIVYVPAALR